MRSRLSGQLLAGAATALCAALAIGGCPSRELSIHVDPSGLSTLFSCQIIPRTCEANLTRAGCERDGFFCTFLPGGKCVVRDPCVVHGVGFENTMSNGVLAGRLLLLDPKTQKALDRSACVEVDLNACPTGDSVCVADAVNAGIARAIPDGLSFGGFHDPDEAILALAIFYPSEGAADPCDRSFLGACAGFAPPPGGGDYNITCASCQGGSRFATGSDTGPCRSGPDTCFLDACATALADAAPGG